MPIGKKQKFCPTCNKYVLAQRSNGSISDGWGCFLSLLTCGLFAPLFLLDRLICQSKPYNCPNCGSNCYKIHPK